MESVYVGRMCVREKERQTEHVCAQEWERLVMEE